MQKQDHCVWRYASIFGEPIFLPAASRYAGQLGSGIAEQPPKREKKKEEKKEKREEKSEKRQEKAQKKAEKKEGTGMPKRRAYLRSKNFDLQVF